jgi:hypothetical protein
MSAKVAFLLREITEAEMQPITVVPTSVIVHRNNQAVVFRIAGDRAVGVQVVPGRRMNDMSEILSGLNIGDKVVTSPAENIIEGTRIKFAQ